jgi:hypothetical protein
MNELALRNATRNSLIFKHLGQGDLIKASTPAIDSAVGHRTMQNAQERIAGGTKDTTRKNFRTGQPERFCTNWHKRSAITKGQAGHKAKSPTG